MPAYSRDGITEIGWASQKRYISLYVMRGDVLDAVRVVLLAVPSCGFCGEANVEPRDYMER